MAKELVLYFSVYGTSKLVAEEIARQTGKKGPLTSGSAVSAGGSSSGSSQNSKSCPRRCRNSTTRSGAAWWSV